MCVLTLCHSLTGRSVKSVGTCLFLVGLEGVGGERGRCVYICMCVFVWAPVGEITHQPNSLETSRPKPFTDSLSSPPRWSYSSLRPLKINKSPHSGAEKNKFSLQVDEPRWSNKKKQHPSTPLTSTNFSLLARLFSSSPPGLSPCLTLSKTDK